MSASQRAAVAGRSWDNVGVSSLTLGPGQVNGVIFYPADTSFEGQVGLRTASSFYYVYLYGSSIDVNGYQGTFSPGQWFSVSVTASNQIEVYWSGRGVLYTWTTPSFPFSPRCLSSLASCSSFGLPPLQLWELEAAPYGRHPPG